MKAIRKSGVMWLKALPVFLLLFLGFIHSPAGLSGAVNYSVAPSSLKIQHTARQIDQSPLPFILEPSTEVDFSRSIPPLPLGGELQNRQTPPIANTAGLNQFFHYRPDQRYTHLFLLYPYHHFW
jgi:hypothetical protein